MDMDVQVSMAKGYPSLRTNTADAQSSCACSFFCDTEALALEISNWLEFTRGSPAGSGGSVNAGAL